MTSDNLVQMFFGWEGVGVASYLADRLLLPQSDSANAAAIKAFVVNSVGDFRLCTWASSLCFILDWTAFSFDDIFAAAPTNWRKRNLTFLVVANGMRRT